MMPNISANGIQLEYDTFGKVSSPALLLIMGLSGQMILWEEDFCRQRADQGLYVIRFDNRDVGLSTKIEINTELDLQELIDRTQKGEAVEPPYTLDDMADDVAGLLDGLDIKKAHVCGASMGAMIAQIFAVRYPLRVLSLISISSTTGSLDLIAQHVSPDELQQFSLFVPKEREANIEFTVNGFRELSGPGFPFDEDYVRKVAAELYDRSFCPQGAERQLMAVSMAGNRKADLAKLKISALVIHGDSDLLVPIQGGRETAEAIPGAKLLIIKGMGHDLPRGAWPLIIEAVSEHINTNK